MNTHDKVIVTSFFVTILLVTVGLVNEVIVYEQQDYKIHIMNSELELSLDTNDIDAKVALIDGVVYELEAWHGNGEWWFPESDTDIDKIRELLRSISYDIGEQREIKDKDGYFVLPHNELIVYLNSEIEDVNEILHSYGHTIHYNPNNNPIHWIITPVWIITLFVFGISLLAKTE